MVAANTSSEPDAIRHTDYSVSKKDCSVPGNVFSRLCFGSSTPNCREGLARITEAVSQRKSFDSNDHWSVHKARQIEEQPRLPKEQTSEAFPDPAKTHKTNSKYCIFMR